jgi:hypothetical protein
MRADRTLAVVFTVCTGSLPALAQNPYFSGHWAPEPHAQRVPQAHLVDAVTDQVLATQAEHDAYAVRWCNPVGMPAHMDATLDIRQAERYMIIASAAHSFPRYVYFDLPPRDPLILDPASVGHSDGRWEGDTLVVESYGFAGYDYEQDGDQQVKGLAAIPGGGFRTPRSRLVERLRLTNDGEVLVIESTWTDPNVFQTPHTYAYRYHRLDPSYEPRLDVYCDPFDTERAEFLGEHDQ